MSNVRQRILRTRLENGTEIAYATAGEGPPLLLVPGWVSHLELSWALPPERSFLEALARGRTLIRYDKPGSGMSGERVGPHTFELELEALDAVAKAAGADRLELAGTSMGAPVAASWAASHPGRVERLVLYGGWVRGADVALPPVRDHVLGLIGEHWGLGSDVLTDIIAPDADRGTRSAFARYQREAPSPQVAREILALCYRLDVGDVLARIAVPTLVLHRDRDRAVPVSQGRALADAIPGAKFESLPGRSHLAYIGDVDAVAAEIRRFLGLPRLRRPASLSLTPRQREVAALVAEGLTNRDIAGRLHITERSAESHVERIRDRLGVRSRAQIAAWFAAVGAS